MCGIVGFAGSGDLASLQKMNAIQTHRGPDSHGDFIDDSGKVGLAMRRLSIRDEAGGFQPMSTQDNKFTIVFNGEIFNSPELRDDLVAKGIQFSSESSDTEVILQLYAHEGPSMVKRLNGMFAFVIFDRTKNQLFGARDRFGIKPLYIHKDPKHFVFASELKSLLAFPGINRELNLQSLYHYLTFLAVPMEESIIKGVERLSPGHSFKLDCQTLEFSSEAFWTFNPCKKEQHNVHEWAEQIRAEAEASVKRWMLSDVPIACSLSGGIDSTAIVGMLANSGVKNLSTFTLGFSGSEESEWDERHLAKEVADRWGTQHHEIIMNPDDLLSDLISMIWHLDEPYAGGLPSWYVFRGMSKDVKVGLTGSGGDELFGNYGKWRRLEKSLAFRAQTQMRKLTGCGTPFGNRYHAMIRYLNDDDKRNKVLTDRFDPCEDTALLLQKLYDKQPSNCIRDSLAGVDFRTQLPEEFLFMTDRFSMAHSLEARVPFLDNEMVDLAYKIPGSMRTHKRDHKYLLKLAMQDLLPDSILEQKKKGFVIPIKRWLSQELRGLVDTLLSPEALKKQDLFRSDFYQNYVTPHFEGKANYTWQIWAMLMFQLWNKVYIENPQEGAPSFHWKDLC